MDATNTISLLGSSVRFILGFDNEGMTCDTVLITPLAVVPDSAVMKLAEQLYADLLARGVDVILDDRDDRPGVKFKDADLVGFPIRLAIGEKSLAKGEVELKRRGGELIPIKAEEAVPRVMEMLAGK